VEFSKIYEEITKKISLDDFVRVLPAGQSQIKETGIGNSQKEDFTDTELD
jgi:hypothetical protein